jgi:ferritin
MNTLNVIVSMKLLILAISLIPCAYCGEDDDGNHCTPNPPETPIPLTWIDMERDCAAAIQAQIKEELTASLTYLVMSSHFAGDRSYRPGVSAFFLQNSVEERSHAKILIEYHQMRGGEIYNSAIPTLVPKATKWDSIEDALRMALAMEESVTANITKIISTCEAVPKENGEIVNDYHAVDYLTGGLLAEQYTSMREISGKLGKLTKMMREFGDLGELVFDKSLQ